jgi:uncharacterized lipoprotein YbaY
MRISRFIVMLLTIALCSSNSFGQGWLDFGAALPRLSIPGTSFNTPNYGVSNVPNSIPFNNTGVPNAGFPNTGIQNAGPMLVPGARDWKLGVTVQNTDVGAVVQQVGPGSAAQQAGIEPNDVIVAVSGTRIGQFDNRFVEIADEIRRSTDPTGRVSLLVQDSRTLQLRSMVVSMTSGTSSLSGSAAIRDQAQLPYGSTLTVQLQNASKPYYEIAGGKLTTRADGYGPFGFALNYNPQFIDPRDQYQLTAFISVNNQVVYALPQPIQIAANGLNQPFNIVLERAGYAGPVTAGGVNIPGIPGNVVNAGYPSGIDPNGLGQLFQQLLGRAPSSREMLAWQSYLQQGNTINDIKVKLLSSGQFRERFSSEAAYIQQLLTTVFNRAPNQSELGYWVGRYQATRSPETVWSEMLAQNR